MVVTDPITNPYLREQKAKLFQAFCSVIFQAFTHAAVNHPTTGPQCCGKSSFLRTYGNGTIKDISLDDQRDVYVPIPTETFLHAYDDNNDGDESKSDDKQDPLIQQVYQGKRLQREFGKT